MVLIGLCRLRIRRFVKDLIALLTGVIGVIVLVTFLVSDLKVLGRCVSIREVRCRNLGRNFETLLVFVGEDDGIRFLLVVCTLLCNGGYTYVFKEFCCLVTELTSNLTNAVVVWSGSS